LQDHHESSHAGLGEELFSHAKKVDNLKLERVRDAVFEAGHWSISINDDSAARRENGPLVGAFFHFRHWYDVARRGISTKLDASEDKQCMVLRIRADNVLAYESCASALEFDAIEWKGTEKFKAELREKAVENMLSKIRRVKESGRGVKNRLTDSRPHELNSKKDTETRKVREQRGKDSSKISDRAMGIELRSYSVDSHRAALRGGAAAGGSKERKNKGSSE
jgi:hypothetical protein